MLCEYVMAKNMRDAFTLVMCFLYCKAVMSETKDL